MISEHHLVSNNSFKELISPQPVINAQKEFLKLSKIQNIILMTFLFKRGLLFCEISSAQFYSLPRNTNQECSTWVACESLSL